MEKQNSLALKVKINKYKQGWQHQPKRSALPIVPVIGYGTANDKCEKNVHRVALDRTFKRHVNRHTPWPLSVVCTRLPLDDLMGHHIHSSDDLGTGPQHEMKSVAEDNLRTHLAQFLRCHGLNCAVGAHWHEGGCLHRAAVEYESAAAGRAIGMQ